MELKGPSHRADVSDVLAQMKALRANAAVGELSAREGVAGIGAGDSGSGNLLAGSASTSGPSAISSFSTHLVNALDSVNATQQTAAAKADGFVRGEHRDLVSVMVASQKATVAFQAVTQVRNRLVTAYEDIMKMPI